MLPLTVAVGHSASNGLGELPAAATAECVHDYGDVVKKRYGRSLSSLTMRLRRAIYTIDHSRTVVTSRLFREDGSVSVKAGAWHNDVTSLVPSGRVTL